MAPLLTPPRTKDTSPEQTPGESPGGAATPGTDAPVTPPDSTPKLASAAAPTCRNCGSPMRPDQEWCLQCGAGAPDSLSSGPRWRPLATALLATAILVAGAAVAAAAALDKRTPARTPTTVTVAQQPVTPTTSVPSTTPTTPGLATPTTSTPTTVPSLPKIPTVSTPVTPPKIPLTTPTPKGTGTGTTQPSTTTGTGTGTTKTGTETGTKGAEAQAEPVVLDTDAASTYDPYGYPEANFGDPSLAIDGETSTAWTAQVEPSAAPRMAEGLVLDLKAPQKLARLEIHSATPGVTVEIYGSIGKTAPTTITDPAWVLLSPTHALKKVTKLKLHTAGKGYRRVLVWITKLPPEFVGTAQAPGHASLNELSLYPPAS